MNWLQWMWVITMSENWRNHLFDYLDSYEYMGRLRTGFPPLIICIACNGGVHGKEYNLALPESADEIAQSAFEAYKAGASMVHIHARDPDYLSQGAKNTGSWIEVNRKVREKCPDIIINNTTGGGPTSTMEERLSCLDAGPEIASLNVTPDMVKFTLKPRESPLPDPRPELHIDHCTPFTYKIVTEFASEMKKRNIKPEIETYHPGGAWVINHLIKEGLVEQPYWIQTVMGYQSSSYPTVDNVLQMLHDLPKNSFWLCSGIGVHQLQMTTLATLMGGHVRVGLEDNVYYAKGQLIQSNAQVVERAVRIAKELNREVAIPTQAREMLGLPQTPKRIP
jgi:3-keto-5-aminohexanoate cleavage enzyme